MDTVKLLDVRNLVVMSRGNYAAVLEINTAEGISPVDSDDIEELVNPASPTDDMIDQVILMFSIISFLQIEVVRRM